MKLKSLLTIVCISFLMACGGGGNNSNSSSNSNLAKSNSNNTENKNTVTENKNAEKKSNLETVNESGKIKPDTNAKIENGKVFSTPFFDITLPAGWQAKKNDTTGFYTYAPAKTDEIIEVTLGYNFVTEDDKEEPRKWLEKSLESSKKSKDEGYFDEFGTFGVGANAETAVPPVLGVIDMRDRPHKDLKDEFKNDKCSSKNPSSCGVFSWDGYMFREEKKWSFVVLFPPGTYEKNKPTIDAVLTSIKFK